MGCDIHGFVEVRDVRPETLSQYSNGYNPTWEVIISAGDFLGRNYNLFGVLAGVRWYDSSWDWEPIAMLRGLPDDSNWRIKDDNRYYDKNEGKFIPNPDMHSQTWMLLSEIEAFDWNKKIETAIWNPEFRNDETVEPIIKKQVSLYDYCDDFKTIRALMETLVSIYGDENVRLVIWFDN
jgi:hypothetical protein